MKTLLLAAIIFSVFISCKKENGSYPSQLISTDYQILSSPKVYMKHGEIMDRTVIENYIKGWGGQYFFFNTDTVINLKADTILFESKDIVIIPQLQGEWGKRVVKQNGQYLFLYMTDTLAGYKRMDNILNSIIDNIGIVKPYHKDACPAYMGASCLTEWVYDAFIATGTPNRLEFPLLTYKISRGLNGFSTGLALQNYNNVFDPSVLNLLQEGDTLAIQTSKRVYTRRN